MSDNIEILEELHKILSCNVKGDIAYHYRYLGFFGEFDFFESFAKAQISGAISPEVKLYDGGYFLPKNNNNTSSLIHSVYLTISSDEPEGAYVHLASKMTNISEDIFFIKFTAPNNINEWPLSDPMGCDILIRTPPLKFYIYDESINRFIECKFDDLKVLFSEVGQRTQSQKHIPEETKNGIFKNYHRSVEIFYSRHM